MAVDGSGVGLAGVRLHESGSLSRCAFNRRVNTLLCLSPPHTNSLNSTQTLFTSDVCSSSSYCMYVYVHEYTQHTDIRSIHMGLHI